MIKLKKDLSLEAALEAAAEAAAEVTESDWETKLPSGEDRSVKTAEAAIRASAKTAWAWASAAEV